MSVFKDGVETINGCPVVETIGVVKIIDHPVGYTAYHRSRIGTRTTINDIRNLAKRYNEGVMINADGDEL